MELNIPAKILQQYPQIPLGRGANLTGKRYGRLVALYRVAGAHSKEGYWLCKCDCGTYKVVRARCLNGFHTTSCGCYSKEIRKTQHHSGPENLIGQRFGKLTVIQEALKQGYTRWRCLCDCGNIKDIQANHLKEGTIINCGCERINSHGELMIKQLLIANNIDFKQEFTPQDLEFKGRFDFAILGPDKEVIYFIEYDGKQHFASYKGCYNHNIEYDKIKNDYCYESGLPLIRIPYTVKSITIEDLLLETSQYIMSEAKEKEYYAI